eukprot:gi/632977701/ref/XP_007905494.1/ PREDICTED: E3 ubiquitin-protein ligase TTC3-like isoform X1 [Callorhinchus milii]
MDIIDTIMPLLERVLTDDIAPEWIDLQRNTALTILLAQFAGYIERFAVEGETVLSGFEKEREINNGKIGALETKGEDEVNINDFKGAIITYGKAIEISPYNYYLYCRRAYCHLQVNEDRMAVLDGIRAALLKPDYFKGHYFCAKGLLSAGFPKHAMMANKRGTELCQAAESDATVLEAQMQEIENRMKLEDGAQSTKDQSDAREEQKKHRPEPEMVFDARKWSNSLGGQGIGLVRGSDFQAVWQNLMDNMKDTDLQGSDGAQEREVDQRPKSKISTSKSDKKNTREESRSAPNSQQGSERHGARKKSSTEMQGTDKVVFDPAKCRLWRAVNSERELIANGVEDVSFLLYRLKLKRFLSEGDQEVVERQSTPPLKLRTLIDIVLKKSSNLEIRKFTSVLVAIDGLKPDLFKWVNNLESMGNCCADSFLYLFLEVLAEPLNKAPLKDLIYSLQMLSVLTETENDLLMKTPSEQRGQRLLEVIVFMKTTAQKLDFVFLLEEERETFPKLKLCLEEFQKEFEKLGEGYVNKFRRYMPLPRPRRREDLPPEERNAYCNFFRLMYLIVLEGTRVAQKVFAEEVPLDGLQAELRKLRKSELHRHFREFQTEFLSHSDWALLFPQKWSELEFDKFDLTLIVFVMMNLKHLPQPKRGWHMRPSGPDASRQGSLLRLLYLRRQLVTRNGYMGVPEEEFLSMWEESSEALQCLGKTPEEIQDILFMPGYLLWHDHERIARLMGRQCFDTIDRYMTAMKQHLKTGGKITDTIQWRHRTEREETDPEKGKAEEIPTPDGSEREASKERAGEGNQQSGQNLDIVEEKTSVSSQVAGKAHRGSKPSDPPNLNETQKPSFKKRRKKSKGKKKSAFPVESVGEKEVESTGEEDREEEGLLPSQAEPKERKELAELEATARTFQLLYEEKSAEYEQLVKQQGKAQELCKHQTAELQRLRLDMENERKVQEQETKTLKSQIRSLQGALKSKEEQLRKFEKQMRAQEQEVDNQNKHYQREQEQWDQEKARLERVSANSRDNFVEAMMRAMSAEIQVLECWRDKAIMILQEAVKEGEMKLPGLRQQLMSTSSPPIDLKAAILAYETLQSDIKSKIHNTTSSFNEQIDLVRNGAKLSSLPPLASLLPPSQADFMMIYMSKQKELLDSDTTVNSVPMTLPPAYPPGLGTLGTNQLVIAQRSMSPGLFSQTPLQHQAPIGQANPGPVGSTNANHLERLMERLFELFPHHNRETMIGFLKEVRTRNNNSLSGLSFDQIIGHVTVLIKNQEPISSGNSNVDYPIFPVDVPPSGLWRPGNPDPFKMSWQGNPILPLQQSGGSGDMNVLQVKNNAVCEMCHEELTANHLFVLKCGHRYHPECISVWLKEHKTCPSCALGYPASFL